MPDLRGKVAVVTGSTKGIGVAIAERLAAAGASVVVSARTARDVEATVERMVRSLAAPAGSTGGGTAEGGRSGAGAPPRVIGVPCDVADPVQCAHLMEETVRTLGRLDILVNNAGLGILKPVTELTLEEWRLQVDVNLGGVFYCSKAALPHLAAHGDGWIINIGSLASRNSFAGGTGYNASKFGLLGMTEAMMLDVRDSGVRVSLIMPGSVNTYFGGREQRGERDWRLEAEDCALAVMQLLEYPKEAHVSRIEMRPSRPRKG